MIELNGCEPRRVKVLGPYAFSIGDTSSFSDYAPGGGIVTQVKTPEKHSFRSFVDSIDNPDFVVTDFGKLDRHKMLHVAFFDMHRFRAQRDRLPRPGNDFDAEAFVNFVINSPEDKPFTVVLEPDFLRVFAKVTYIVRFECATSHSTVSLSLPLPPSRFDAHS